MVSLSSPMVSLSSPMVSLISSVLWPSCLAHKLVEVVLLFTVLDVLVWTSLGHLKVSLRPMLEEISVRVLHGVVEDYVALQVRRATR